MLLARSVVFTILMAGSAGVMSAAELLCFWAPFRVKWSIAVAWAAMGITE